uniref:Uncharacterized protein n=1 Tax=Salix viminalis TaxID=40686 RepID=A0A6N2MGX3_SALVM
MGLRLLGALARSHHSGLRGDICPRSVAGISSCGWVSTGYQGCRIRGHRIIFCVGSPIGFPTYICIVTSSGSFMITLSR